MTEEEIAEFVKNGIYRTKTGGFVSSRYTDSDDLISSDSTPVLEGETQSLDNC